MDDGDPNLAVWHVYSRGSTAEAFGLRGSTTSNSFHDNGPPDLQYYVTAEDLNGFESAPSPTVTIDERLALPAPATLLSTSLDGAIALAWADNAHNASPSRFSDYRIYSAAYDLDTGFCDAAWFLEGTTVAPEFIAGRPPQRAAALLRGHRRQPSRGTRASGRRSAPIRRGPTRGTSCSTRRSSRPGRAVSGSGRT